ncbi:MAG TPA: PKD domain-containing protein [Bacteroidales bacterium]|nr:PKD domain-containing protein [Bacteroidales bacterium]HPI85217.1 PKD domain-containing protein [Bacteroidales bacterium]
MALKRLLIISTVLLVCQSSMGQKQANYWYFGVNAGLSFAMGAPVALTNGALNTGEGCSSISTSSGNLEFYTDGRFVYNREHDQMPHGSGLLGHSSSTQSGIIVPKPGSTTQYYIFTVDAKDNGLAAGLCYSRVDMTLEGGLGDVVTTEKNISLLPYACEKVTAVGHSNGISIWVITHLWNSDAYYAFEVTTNGVNVTPVISHTGPAITGDMEASKGYIKVSPDGSKIGIANNTAFHVSISNFSNSSGTVSHLVTDYNYVNPGGSDPGGPYGVEFSPNSHFLYIGEWKANKRIWQYDVSTNDPDEILDSKVMVGSVAQDADPIGALQLGPDNRMYIARNGSAYLSRINSPNVAGTGCGFTDNAVNLAGRQSRYGLPPFIQSFFYLSADFYWDVPSCDGTPVQFYTSASDNPDSVKWNFGDPGSGAENQSTLVNPTHLFTNTGNYWVTLNVYLYGVMKNAFHIVVVREQPEVYIGNDTTLCAYEPFYLDAGSGFEHYLWSNGDTTQISEITTSGTHWCKVTGEGGCTDTDYINVTLNPVPDVYAGDDQTIANGTATTILASLTGGSGDFTYDWSPAALLVNPHVLQPTTVNLTGTTLFTLTVTDNAGGCVNSDQVLINVLGGALGCFPYADPEGICTGNESQLHAMPTGGSGSYIYTWTSTPSGFNSDLANPFVNPSVTTTYHLSLYDGYSTVNGNVTLPVYAHPLPDAGTDQSIPYGTSTTLHGYAGSGSGSYSYHWEPAGSLVNPNVQHPTTTLLEVTTMFSLTVTDTETGCISEDPDVTIVTVTGGPLAVQPQALPDTICSGETTQLFAMASGGADWQYTYNWSSNPPGFSNTTSSPFVTPTVTTTYTVQLDDGYKQVVGSVTVIVNPTPAVNLGPDLTICVFDTVRLDAGYWGAGTKYLWSNGDTVRTIPITTTGIGFDLKNIWVTVTSPAGCVTTDNRLIIFDFAACNGIDDPSSDNGFSIYPNPGNGTLRLETTGKHDICHVTVADAYGRTIIRDHEIRFSSSNPSSTIDLTGYSPGIYLVRITENGRELAYLKYLLK